MASVAKFDEWQDRLGVPVGTILQIQSTNITTVVSTTVTDGTSIGGDVGLNVTITPRSSNSKFLIIVDVGIGTNSSGNSWAAILSRDGSRIGTPNVSGHGGALFRSVDHAGNNGTDTNHGVGGGGSWMDTTSGTIGTPITFKCGFAGEGGTTYINRVESDYSSGTSVAGVYTSSTITVMEIVK